MQMAKLEIANSTLQAIPARARQHREPVAYTMVFCVCFIVFLWAMAIERLLPREWRQMSDPYGHKSVWSNARDTAHRCTAIAFQG